MIKRLKVKLQKKKQASLPPFPRQKKNKKKKTKNKKQKIKNKKQKTKRAAKTKLLKLEKNNSKKK
jgi:hypothetical protein